MGSAESSREPCPDRILDDIGGSFGMGAVGGSAVHFAIGVRNSPWGARISGGMQAVRMKAPRLGGRCAMWGAVFSTFDCTSVYLRHKEDPWNSIVAGAAASGLLRMRQGPAASARSALFAGVILAFFEGASIMFDRFLTPQQPVPSMHNDAAAAASNVRLADGGSQGSSGSSSWLGGWFGKKEEDETRAAASSGSETKVLESFDAPPVPNFDFK